MVSEFALWNLVEGREPEVSGQKSWLDLAYLKWQGSNIGLVEQQSSQVELKDCDCAAVCASFRVRATCWPWC